MKTSPLVVILALLATTAFGQEIRQDLRSFHTVIASPKINLILEQGEKESIRLVYADVAPDKINIEVKGNTLRIYLDDAKVTEKLERINAREKRSIYHNTTVTAYVTYRELRQLEIRGNQELTCHSPLNAEKFILKGYGENEITLSSLKTGYLKTSLYGENQLKINGGAAEYQKYRLFGENKIDTQPLKSYSTTTNIYGESKIKLTTQDELRVNSFGESNVSYNGNAHVSKGLVFGKTEISRIY